MIILTSRNCGYIEFLRDNNRGNATHKYEHNLDDQSIRSLCIAQHSDVPTNAKKMTKFKCSSNQTCF